MRWIRQRHDYGPFGRQRVAFVLSGGGSLGAMQAGQLRAMFEAGITPDLVIGVSAGALNGAAIAYDPSIAAAEQLATIWKSLRATTSSAARGASVPGTYCGAIRTSTAPTAWSIWSTGSSPSTISRNWAPRSKRALSTSTTPVSTSTPSATPRGARCLGLASGRVQPVEINGSRHVDGGIAVDPSRSSGTWTRRTTIFAFDCRAGTKHQLPARLSALGVLTSSIAVTREILTPSHDHLNVIRLPAPDIQGIGLVRLQPGQPVDRRRSRPGRCVPRRAARS